MLQNGIRARLVLSGMTLLGWLGIFFSYRRNNCYLSAKRKRIHVVGLACASVAHQREKCDLEGIQEEF
jgi:hypothetical protein